MTALDRLIVLGLLGAAILSFQLTTPGEAGERVVVEQRGKVVFTAPLNSDRRLALPGPLGETVLVIHDGRVCVESSPCPRKICMGMGEISRSGELLACVPNELLIRVEGGRQKERDYDLLSR